MNRLAIIPARGGSKRIPNKNIRDFCGKPIIEYILKTLQESELFNVIHVSTDSTDIKNFVSSIGFLPDFKRPDNLADDLTPILPVLKYVCKEYFDRGQFFDQVWMFSPLSPFLEVEDLKSAEELFIESGSNTPLLGVSSYQVPVEWAFTLSQNGKLTPMQPGMFAKRSQDLVEKYFDIGSFSIFPSKKILESKGAGNDHEFVGKVFPNYKSIDIDTPDDWLYAEALYRGLFIHKNTE